MKKEIISILYLAAMSDGIVDDIEKGLIRNYREYFPSLKGLSDQEFNESLVDLTKKIQAGMKEKYIIDDIGSRLTNDEKNAAYALAVEVCASNFRIVPAESNIISIIQTNWKINILFPLPVLTCHSARCRTESAVLPTPNDRYQNI